MAKTANIYVRVEPEVKEQAESILEPMGISISNAVNMFLNQIILQRGIPFEMKVPMAGGVPDLTRMTPEQIDALLEKSYQDMLAGRTIPAEQAFDELRKRYGLPERDKSEHPKLRIPDMSKMTAEELDAELEKGYQDVLAGRTRPAKEVFDEIWSDFGI